MKWVTREKARVDRIACPWLISRFIDKEATFLFVQASQVMQVAERERATPYDVPGVELGHHGDHCSFDAFLDKYKLNDPRFRPWRSSYAALTPTPASSRRSPPASMPLPRASRRSRRMTTTT